MAGAWASPAPFWWCVTAVSLLFSLLSPLHAASIVAFDIDDTSLSTGEVHGGTFGTKRVLFRIENPGLAIVPYPEDLPAEILVSPGKYRYLRDNGLLGRGERAVGTLKTAKLEDGTVIHPGFYYLDAPRSYRRFREGPPSENYLLNDFKDAEQAGDASLLFGPAWDRKKFLLENKETAASVFDLTSRGHSRKEGMQLYRYQQKQGYISELPQEDNLYFLSRPEFLYLSAKGDPFEAKINLIREWANHLRTVPLDPEADLRLDPFGERETPLHTIVFYEDNQACASAARDLFIELMRTSRYPIKFVLVNTGLQSHFRETKEAFQYRASVIMPDGRFRKASISEQLGLREQKKTTIRCVKELEAYFSKGKKN